MAKRRCTPPSFSTTGLFMTGCVSTLPERLELAIRLSACAPRMMPFGCVGPRRWKQRQCEGFAVLRTVHAIAMNASLLLGPFVFRHGLYDSRDFADLTQG